MALAPKGAYYIGYYRAPRALCSRYLGGVGWMQLSVLVVSPNGQLGLGADGSRLGMRVHGLPI